MSVLRVPGVLVKALAGYGFPRKKITYELKLILGNFKPTGTSLRKPKHKQGVRKQTLL